MLQYHFHSLSKGPQPDWDPDIVASLDNPDLNFDLDDQLEDDFILQVSRTSDEEPAEISQPLNKGHYCLPIL